jgi:hypothetical protein
MAKAKTISTTPRVFVYTIIYDGIRSEFVLIKVFENTNCKYFIGWVKQFCRIATCYQQSTGTRLSMASSP